MNAEVMAHAYIMETFLRRENLRYRRIDSKTSNSVYFEITGPRMRHHLRRGARLLYRLRVSDHVEHGEREAHRRTDFSVLSARDLRTAQTSIEARVIRPLARERKAA